MAVLHFSLSSTMRTRAALLADLASCQNVYFDVLSSAVFWLRTRVIIIYNEFAAILAHKIANRTNDYAGCTFLNTITAVSNIFVSPAAPTAPPLLVQRIRQRRRLGRGSFVGSAASSGAAASSATHLIEAQSRLDQTIKKTWWGRRQKI